MWHSFILRLCHSVSIVIKPVLKKEEQSEEINAQANKDNPVVKKIVTEKHTEAKSKSIIRGNRRVINTDDGQKNIF